MARYARLRSASPQRGEAGGKKDKLQKEFYTGFGLLCLATHSQARIVTLTVGGTKTNDFVNIGTNDVVTIISSGNGPGSGYVQVEKDGLRWDYQSHDFDTGLSTVRRVVVAGPARVSLSVPIPNENKFLSLDIQPDSFPPDKTVIIPEGSGANIVLESSTNLVHWMVAAPGLYTNRTGNLFFRIRADRIP